MHRKLNALSIAAISAALHLLILAAPAFAATPPRIPADRLRTFIPGAEAIPVPPIKNGTPVAPYTLETLEKSHLSGVVYQGIRAGLMDTPMPRGRAIATGTADRAGGTLDRTGGTGRGSFTLAPDATVLNPSYNASADAQQTVEPSVMSIAVNGVDRTTSTFIDYDTANTPRIHYATTTNFSTFTRGMLPLPTGYTLTGDPLMDENPYTGGIAGLRMYTVGIAFNDINNPQNAPNAIALWHSDPADNGAWTAAPSIVDLRGAGYFVDKPDVAVSWHNGTDLGYVYVAYVSYDYVNNNSAIVVARSTNGGATFPQQTVIAYGPGPTTGNSVANPQVLVAPGSGAVYVIWVDFGAGDLRMSRSLDFGVTWGAHEIAGTGVMTGNLNGSIRAETVPMARYNSVANSINLVWHDRGANGTAEVEYAYKDSTGWHRPALPIVQFTANDQFMPALDFNVAGNVVVTYYDRHNDPSNFAYRAYEAYITSAGSRIDAADNWMGGFDSTVFGLNHFIGDYQDVWDWTYAGGERATASWIGVNGNYENWLTRISF